MLRSLYSGISGLQAHQTMLDVTGNNIANVNTVGFKSSAVRFEDTLSQLTQGASAPNGGTGGHNPAQLGLGVRVAGIETNFTQGSAESTGKGTDLMINGDGFFIVNNGTQQLYTRAGDFDFDSAGELVAPDGSLVQGWTADATGKIDQSGALGKIVLPLNAVVAAAPTASASFSGNLPSDAAPGTVLNRDVPVYDAAGNLTTHTLSFTAGATPGSWTVTDPATALSQALSFNASGQLITPAAPAVVTDAGDGVAYDFSKLSGYAGLSTVAVSGQDGHAAGTLTSYSIAPDGTVNGSFSNGVIQPIAKLAMATFTNPGGLQKDGDSLYEASVNSGTMQIGGATDPGFGQLAPGYLEASNVDLSQEFTNLIVAQRGFQANARIITTSDSVLEELVDLKRQ